VSTLLTALRAKWRDEPAQNRCALVALMAIAIAVRLLNLTQPIRLDEKLTYVHFVSRSWSVAISDYAMPNNHIFHTLLAKMSTAMLGPSLVSLRLPALVAGVLVVPATYVAVRLLYGAPSAMVATALVATSQDMVDFSTNARGYSLTTLAFLLLVITADRLQEARSMRLWIAFVLVATLGLWTMPVMLLPLGAVITWMAAASARRSAWSDLRPLGTALLATAGLTALCYSPVLAHGGLTDLVRNEYVVPSPWPVFVAEFPATVSEALWTWSRGLPRVLAYGFAVCVVVALASHARVSRRMVALPATAGAVCVAFLALNHRAPPVRVWQWWLPVLAGLVGAGLVRMIRTSPRAEAYVAPRFAALALALGVIGAVALFAAPV